VLKLFLVFFQIGGYSSNTCTAVSLEGAVGGRLGTCVANGKKFVIWYQDTATGALSYQAYDDSLCTTPYGTLQVAATYPTVCTAETGYYQQETTSSHPPNTFGVHGVGFGIFSAKRACNDFTNTHLNEYNFSPLNTCQFYHFDTKYYMLTSCTGTPGAFTVNYNTYSTSDCSGTPDSSGVWTTAADTCNNHRVTVNGIASGYLNALCI